MNGPVTLFLLFFGILFVIPSAAHALERHVYVEDTGAKRVFSRWMLEKTEGGFHLTSVKGDEVSECLLGPDFNTREWRLDRPETQTLVVVRRTADGIALQGGHEGEEISRLSRIDEKPWYQATSLSLRKLTRSKESTALFWTIRPDNLSALRLRATKGGREPITVGGQAYRTQVIRISLAGILSFLGSGTYWFRVSDGVLVRYEGPAGWPGSNRILIRIVPEHGRR